MVPARHSTRVAIIELKPEKNSSVPLDVGLEECLRAPCLTVEPVLESAAIDELATLSYCGRQDAVEDGVEEVVRQRPASGVEAEQTSNAIRRPTHFALQLREAERLGGE